MDAARLDILFRLLWLMAAALGAGFLGLAGVNHLDTRRSSENLYRDILAAASSNSRRGENAELDDALRRIEPAATQADGRIDDPARFAEVMQRLRTTLFLDPLRLRTLEQCPAAAAAPASDTLRQPRLEACLLVLQGLRREAPAPPNVETLKLLLDVARLEEEAKQSARAIWVQATQIAFNVILPLITAVLGYFFATSRASDATPRSG